MRALSLNIRDAEREERESEVGAYAVCEVRKYGFRRLAAIFFTSPTSARDILLVPPTSFQRRRVLSTGCWKLQRKICWHAPCDTHVPPEVITTLQFCCPLKIVAMKAFIASASLPGSARQRKSWWTPGACTGGRLRMKTPPAPVRHSAEEKSAGRGPPVGTPPRALRPSVTGRAASACCTRGAASATVIGREVLARFLSLPALRSMSVAPSVPSFGSRSDGSQPSSVRCNTRNVHLRQSRDRSKAKRASGRLEGRTRRAPKSAQRQPCACPVSRSHRAPPRLSSLRPAQTVCTRRAG